MAIRSFGLLLLIGTLINFTACSNLFSSSDSSESSDDDSASGSESTTTDLELQGYSISFNDSCDARWEDAVYGSNSSSDTSVSDSAEVEIEDTELSGFSTTSDIAEEDEDVEEDVDVSESMAVDHDSSSRTFIMVFQDSDGDNFCCQGTYDTSAKTITFDGLTECPESTASLSDTTSANESADIDD